MLRYLTSGESHGQSLISIIDGLPSNVELNFDEINAELKKRQCGYGRGGRMKIESDKVNILGGVRGKKTLGGPVSIEVKNRDYQNWTEYMAPMDDVDFETRKVDNVRPGHADLVGCLKYDFTDARNVLERSSARETASRVAVGAICKQVLKNFDIDFVSHVIQIGNVKDENVYDFDYIKNNVDSSEVRCANKDMEAKMISQIDEIKNERDTIGGVVEVRVKNLIPGLGSYTQFDRKIEGGMTTGEELVVRCAMKPIPTLYKPLNSINVNTLEKYEATVERSDTCAVPACSVVCENVVAFVICQFFLDTIGGSSLEDIKRNYNSYVQRLGERGWKK